MSGEKRKLKDPEGDKKPKRLRHNRYVQYVVALVVLILAIAFIGITRTGERTPQNDKLFWIKKDTRMFYPTVKRISTINLANWPTEDDTPQPVLVDVRTPLEYAVSSLKGAINVTDDPEAGLKILQEQGVQKDQPIVTYCSVGWRSAGFARRLNMEGYRFVWNLEGSIFQWANEGRPVYRNGEEVNEVHPYDKSWSYMLEAQYHSFKAGRE